MKRLICLIFAASFMAVAAMASSPKRLFADVADMKGVSSTYIGSSLINRASGMSLSHGGSIGYFLPKFTKNLEMVEVIEADSDECDVKVVLNACLEIIRRMDLEIILDSKQDDSIDRIYVSKPKDAESSVSDCLLILNYDSDSLDLLYVKGEVDLQILIGRFAGMQ